MNTECKRHFVMDGHTIAICGFNITILAALVITLTGRTLGRRKGVVVVAIVIAFYTILVGADTAVVRAAIMGGLALYARFLGRVTLTLALLSVAVMCYSHGRIDLNDLRALSKTHF